MRKIDFDKLVRTRRDDDVSEVRDSACTHAADDGFCFSRRHGMVTPSCTNFRHLLDGIYCDEERR